MTVRIGLKSLATVAVAAALCGGLVAGAGLTTETARAASASVPTSGSNASVTSAGGASMAHELGGRAASSNQPRIPGKLVALVVFGVLYAVGWTVMQVARLIKKAGRKISGTPAPDENEVAATALASLRDGRSVEDGLAHVPDPVARTLQRRAAEEAAFWAARHTTRTGHRLDSAWSREEHALERARRGTRYVNLARYEAPLAAAAS